MSVTLQCDFDDDENQCMWANRYNNEMRVWRSKNIDHISEIWQRDGKEPDVHRMFQDELGLGYNFKLEYLDNGYKLTFDDEQTITMFLLRFNRPMFD